uniref:Ribonuclease Z n=1 Tax=Apoglossum ruscifolium TaxID=167976 RepID=A0A4D6WSM5_9FLOR|nr:ribonuclease Z [Apoglossum ruscifolium]
MNINFFNNSISRFKYFNTSFMIQFLDFKDIWLFNCCEGCQYILNNNNCKINNISKIIITDMHINNISGLMGLLSSLNLIGRIKSLHIYAPKDLVDYLNLCKKYSHTNFSYIVYIHILKTGLVINSDQYRLYSFVNDFQYEFIIMELEQYGKFILSKARENYLIPGPLYGKLKRGVDFILPDGFSLNGNDFTVINLFGSQLSFLLNKYYKRRNIESSMKSNIIFY